MSQVQEATIESLQNALYEAARQRDMLSMLVGLVKKHSKNDKKYSEILTLIEQHEKEEAELMKEVQEEINGKTT